MCVWGPSAIPLQLYLTIQAHYRKWRSRERVPLPTVMEADGAVGLGAHSAPFTRSPFLFLRLSVSKHSLQTFNKYQKATEETKVCKKERSFF